MKSHLEIFISTCKHFPVMTYHRVCN